MKFKLRRTVASFVSTAAILAAASAASAEEQFKLAHFVSPKHTITQSIVEPLKQGVETDSKGDMQISVYPGGELGAGPVEQYVRALQGVADITWGLAGYTSSQFEKTMLVELPGAIPEGKTGYDMLWNAFDSKLKSEFPGTRPLAMWVSEPNVFIMKDKEINTPDDLKGLKLRVSGKMAADVISALGATPVQMPAPQMYNALQTGLIDGIVTGSSAISDFKLDEVANVYTVGAPLGQIMFYLVMNQKRYDSLSDEQRAIFDKHSGRGLSKSGEESWQSVADATLERLTASSDEKVINLSADQIAKFNAIIEPLVANYLNADSERQATMDAMLNK